MSRACVLDIRVESGVPLVDVRGAEAPSSSAIAAAVQALARAGHLEIVVNLQQAGDEVHAVLQGLVTAAREVRAHHGHLVLVGALRQAIEKLAPDLRGLFHVAASESSALSRIKRARVCAAGTCCTARVVI